MIYPALSRILIVDDHAMFRTGLCMVLRNHLDPDTQIFKVGSLEESLSSNFPTPDLILLDVKLQGLSGLECIAIYRREWPDTPIVMLSSEDAPSVMQQALDYGAAAYISKSESADRVLEVITEIMQKHQTRVIEPEAQTIQPDQFDSTIKPLLTPRQCEVLNMLSEGLPNKSIGRRLDLSENTVRGHVQALLALLKVSSRAEAVFVARRKGLLR